MIEDKHQKESEIFRENFGRFAEKRIVLYGIGRYTATLLPEITDFNIVGLMDRDEENIGKVLYGIPVISKEDAVKKADLIIINTAKSYWKLIYTRINRLNIPVYYLDGSRAKEEESERKYSENEYWNHTYKELGKRINQYDIISFDIFDTLIMRKVYAPMDVYKLVQIKIDSVFNKEVEFYKYRVESQLYRQAGVAQLDEIYAAMNKKLQLSREELETIRNLEIEIEQKCILPRKDMVELLNEVSLKKEVYLLSDMYMTSEEISYILTKCGVQNVEKLHIWVSSEKRKTKQDGSLWEAFYDTVAKGKKALHIGDNQLSDIAMPLRYGIDTFYVMSAEDMLKNSSLGEIVPHIESLGDSIFIGLIMARLFNSPFALNEKKGIVELRDFETLGYCVFGSVIYSFFQWLLKQAKVEKIDRFAFMARDGYLLQRDYEYVRALLPEQPFPASTYFAISRRLVLVASCTTEEAFEDFLRFPYIGSFSDFMYDRFNIQLQKYSEHSGETLTLPQEIEKVQDWIKPYREEITNIIQNERENYLSYLNRKQISETDGLIDLWYHGSNQYYLSQILNKQMTGFYFAANLAEDNQYKENNRLIPCFHSVEDEKAEKCNLYKNALWVESFLTAPYGMIKALDKNGDYLCDEKKMNQLMFDKREMMNDGVCEFIQDYLALTEKSMVEIKPEFADFVFGENLKEHITLSEKLKVAFYYDNTIIQRRETRLFE